MLLLLALILLVCLVLSLTITIDLGPIGWLLASFGAGFPAMLLSLFGFRRYAAPLSLPRFTSNSIIWAFSFGGIVTAVTNPLVGIISGGLLGPLATKLTTKYVVPLLPSPSQSFKEKAEKAMWVFGGIAFFFIVLTTYDSWLVALAITIALGLGLFAFGWAGNRWPVVIFLTVGGVFGSLIGDMLMQTWTRDGAPWLDRIGQVPVTLSFIILGAILGLALFKILNLDHINEQQTP